MLQGRFYNQYSLFVKTHRSIKNSLNDYLAHTARALMTSLPIYFLSLIALASNAHADAPENVVVVNPMDFILTSNSPAGISYRTLDGNVFLGFQNDFYVPTFSPSGIGMTLSSYGSQMITISARFASQLSVTISSTGFGSYCFGSYGGHYDITDTPGTFINYTDKNGGSFATYCILTQFRQNSDITAFISSISYIPYNPLDLSISKITGPQPQPTNVPLQATVGVPLPINVEVTGVAVDGLYGHEANVVVTAGSQTYQQSIPFEFLQMLGKYTLTFPVTFGPQDVGPQTISATVAPGNPLNETNFTNNSASINVNVVPQTLLTISNVHVDQAVPDFKLTNSPADVDLVLGKSTTILFDVSASSGATADSTPVTLSATLSDGTSAPTQTVTMQEIAASTSAQNNSTKTKTVALGPLTTFKAGTDLTLTVQVSTPSEQPIKLTKSVRVKQTNPESIVYVPLQGDTSCPYSATSTTCLSPLALDPETFRTQSDSFIQQTFPVRDKGGVVSIVTSPIAAQTSVSAQCKLAAKFGVDSGYVDGCNFLNTWETAVLANAFYRNAIGIVPDNYSNFTGMDAMGITPTSTFDSAQNGNSSIYNVSLVTEGLWDVAAHEIAHTFGADDSLRKTVPKFQSDLAQIIPFLNMMYTGDCKDPANFTTCSNYRNISSEWIADNTYENIFNGLVSTPNDPNILVVPAIVRNDGQVTLFPIYTASAGYTTPNNVNGNTAVIVNDQQGNLLSQTAFNLADTLKGPVGITVQLEDSFFLVTIPFSSSAGSIQISKSGTVLTEFNPNAQLLTDAIKAIPDQGFVKNPGQMRNALLSKASAFANILATGSNQAAYNKLQNDIRKTVTNSLLPNYSVSSPLQLTSTQVLDVVDLIAAHLQNNLGH